jgi:hypothetical protein
MMSRTRLYVIAALTGFLFFCMTGISVADDMAGWEVPKQSSEHIVIPVSAEELLDKAKQALTAAGAESGTIQEITLDEYGTVYVARMGDTGLPVFARFVARRVPCGDCHDVFFLYTFDNAQFIAFSPVLITKRYNKEWDKDDVKKIKSRFVGKSFKDRVNFNPLVDAIASATMSSKIVFHSLNETQIVYRKLAELGYTQKGK